MAASARGSWRQLFLRTEYGMEWLAYLLSNWKFLEVLDYLGSLGILVAIVFYFAESGDRLKQKHYQAWQVINTAQGKGGSGGRIEALQELNADKVSLVGVDLAYAFLQGLRLKKADLSRANLAEADVREAHLEGAKLDFASLRGGNFRNANLSGTSLKGTVLDDADLNGVVLSGADLSGASMENVDLRNVELREVKWQGLGSVKGTNLKGTHEAPPGFVEWALNHGAVISAQDP
jgi:pentapeptide repeat protein